MNRQTARDLDAMLASAKVGQLKRSEPGPDMERVAEVFDALLTLEARSPGSTGGLMLQLDGFLAGEEAAAHPRHGEIKGHLDELRKQLAPPPTPTPPDPLAAPPVATTLQARRETEESEVDEEALAALLAAEEVDWVLDPVSPGDWRPAEADDEALVRAALVAANLEDRAVEGCRIGKPPFYADTHFVEIQARPGDGGEPGAATVVVTPEKIGAYNGTSPIVHNTNAQEGRLVLDDDNAFAYLRFFCEVVHGEEGPFHIVESAPGQALLPRHAGEGEGGLAEEMKVSSVARNDDKKGWDIHSIVHYGGQIFKAHFLVQDVGMIEMVDDSPVRSETAEVVGRYRGIWRRAEVPAPPVAVESAADAEDALPEGTGPVEADAGGAETEGSELEEAGGSAEASEAAASD